MVFVLNRLSKNRHYSIAYKFIDNSVIFCYYRLHFSKIFIQYFWNLLSWHCFRHRCKSSDICKKNCNCCFFPAESEVINIHNYALHNVFRHIFAHGRLNFFFASVFQNKFMSIGNKHSDNEHYNRCDYIDYCSKIEAYIRNNQVWRNNRDRKCDWPEQIIHPDNSVNYEHSKQCNQQVYAIRYNI